jgi:sulfate permease, SulP family
MNAAAWLRDRLPVLAWWPRYERAWFRSDLVAGVTTASVIIPKAMAYAALAGLAVQVGLYTALLPMAVYALLGSSLRLSVSTTTTIGILTAAEISQLAPGASAEQAATIATSLALLVGVILALAAVLRLGFVAQFISEPVLTGFKAGIGIVIIVDQAPKLLGLHLPKASVLQTAFGLFQALPDRSPPTVVLSIATIAVMLLLARFVPRAPAPLLAVALGIAASAVMGLAALGVETIGSIPSGLPRFTAPDASLFRSLWPGALGIALMSFTESIASGRAFAKSGERRPDANQELLALGAGNALGGLFGAMPAGGGTSQTAVNTRAGARTQVSSLVTTGATAVVIVLLAPLIALMPQATLATVVIVTSIPLIDPAAFAAIRRVRTIEFRWAVAAMLGVIVLGTLPGILVAIILSMVSLLRQANDPAVYVLGRKPGTDVFRPRAPEHPEDEVAPGLLVLRPEGRIYFANAQRIADKVTALVHEAEPRSVVLDLSAVPDIEYTALKTITEMEASLRGSGRVLILAALNPAALGVVQRSPLGPLLGRERMFFTVHQAVIASVARVTAAVSAAPA